MNRIPREWQAAVDRICREGEERRRRQALDDRAMFQAWAKEDERDLAMLDQTPAQREAVQKIIANALAAAAAHE
jgi:hypothetical protein